MTRVQILGTQIFTSPLGNAKFVMVTCTVLMSHVFQVCSMPWIGLWSPDDLEEVRQVVWNETTSHPSSFPTHLVLVKGRYPQVNTHHHLRGHHIVLGPTSHNRHVNCRHVTQLQRGVRVQPERGTCPSMLDQLLLKLPLLLS